MTLLEMLETAVLARRAEADLGLVLVEAEEAMAALVRQCELGLAGEDDRTLPESALVEVATVTVRRTQVASRRLEELLVAAGGRVPGSADEAEYLEKAIAVRLEAAAEVPFSDGVRGRLAESAQMIGGLLRMLIHVGLPPSGQLSHWVREFDHCDEEGAMEAIHSRLRMETAIPPTHPQKKKGAR